MRRRWFAGSVVAAVVFFGLGAFAGDRGSKGDAYPLGKCFVSGQKLGSMGEPVVLLHEGRELRFCCKGCVGMFKRDPKRYLSKLDATVVKDQLPFYPLRKCLVSGEKLGGMGEPVNLVYKNRLIRLCCKGCVVRFKRESEKYLKVLNEAVIKAQKPLYPLTTCVVSGGKLGGMGKPVDFVHANRLYRFCSRGCIGRFTKDPARYRAKVPWKVLFCPMHPKVRTVQPGKCPICSMKLVPEAGKKHKKSS